MPHCLATGTLCKLFTTSNASQRFISAHLCPCLANFFPDSASLCSSMLYNCVINSPPASLCYPPCSSAVNCFPHLKSDSIILKTHDNTCTITLIFIEGFHGISSTLFHYVVLKIGMVRLDLALWISLVFISCFYSSLLDA